MSEPNFTPGPWEFDVELRWVNQPGEQEVHGAWNVYPVDDCDHIIATVNHVYPDRNTCRCNARLLAAAPDLYAALEECAESLELALGRIGCGVQGNDGGGAGKHDADSFGGINVLRRSREALTKAVPHD